MLLANRLPTAEEDAEELIRLNYALDMARKGMAIAIPIVRRRYKEPTPLIDAYDLCSKMLGIIDAAPV